MAVLLRISDDLICLLIKEEKEGKEKSPVLRSCKRKSPAELMHGVLCKLTTQGIIHYPQITSRINRVLGSSGNLFSEENIAKSSNPSVTE